MTDETEAKSALIALLKELGLEPGVPCSLYKIGPPMVAHGYSQDSIVHALYAIKDEGVIDLIEGNRLVVLKQV